MKFSFNDIRQWKWNWKGGISISLSTALLFSWWAISVIAIAVLFLDGLMFYLYGLGYAVEPPAIQGPAEVVRVNISSIENAAKAVETAQSQFTGSSTVPADFPNPFK